MKMKLIIFLFISTITRAHIIQRIVGGHNAALEHEFPNLVALTAYNGNARLYKVFCGGTIVHPKWILTGYICTTYIGTIHLIEKVRVVAGKWNLNNKTSYGQVSTVLYTTAVEHEWLSRIYNIGLVRLTIALIINHWVRPLQLASAKNLTRKGVIAGWGSVYPFDTTLDTDNILQIVDIEIVKIQTCRNLFQKISVGANRALEQIFLSESYICTRFLAKGGSTHSGDIGGPLMMKMESGDYKVIGVISFTNKPYKGAEDMHVTLHAKIGHCRKWIESIIQNYEQNH